MERKFIPLHVSFNDDREGDFLHSRLALIGRIVSKDDLRLTRRQGFEGPHIRPARANQHRFIRPVILRDELEQGLVEAADQFPVVARGGIGIDDDLELVPCRDLEALPGSVMTELVSTGGSVGLAPQPANTSTRMSRGSDSLFMGRFLSSYLA